MRSGLWRFACDRVDITDVLFALLAISPLPWLRELSSHEV